MLFAYPSPRQSGIKHQVANEELKALRDISKKTISEHLELSDAAQALANETDTLKAEKLALEEQTRHLHAEVSLELCLCSRKGKARLTPLV